MKKKKKKLMISVPVDKHGFVETHLVEWMFAIEVEGWEIVKSICRDRPVVQTRNRQMKKFLETDCDVFLTIDSDQITYLGSSDRSGGLHYLLQAIERDEVDIVNAITLRATEKGPVPVLNKMTGPISCELHAEILGKKKGLHELTPDGVMGGAGIMVKRHVIEKFYEEGVPWFKDVFSWEPKKYYDELSGKDLFGERLIGHDIWFFLRAYELGFRAWVDTRLFWGHVKPVDLRGEFRREMDYVSDAMEERQAASIIADVLRETWGNEDWTASPRFLSRVTAEASRLPEGTGAVECGSGLTTALLARCLPADRLMVYENSEDWVLSLRERTSLNGSIVTAPLQEQDGYVWYGTDRRPEFPVSLVVVDGPPNSIEGGRYGALPSLWDNLAPRFRLLVDDTHKAQVREAVDAWKKEYGVKVKQQIQDGDREFMVLEGTK